MINILSYVGMNMHSEVCLWTLLGLVRTIFDATLFKVNANLKQVWQMSMPDDLSLPVQRALRTMISGVMLVQCFTVYVYLASYIVLLYPVFLEERPPLVLPWLLLAATRKLLCELTSLALGLGTCVLLGPAKPPCIKFVIVKLVSIMPAFYMWMLVFSYYHALKVAAAFKTFAAVLPPSDHDFGLELAVRRRKTKSLLGEEQLRNKLVASLYGQRPVVNVETKSRANIDVSSRPANSPDTSIEDIKTDVDISRPRSIISNKLSDTGSYEDWYGSNDVVVPRDADRILEQFVLMMLRIGAYLHKEGITSVDFDILKRKSSHGAISSHNCTSIPADDTDTPLLVGSSKGNTASYVREYPQIFMKRTLDIPRLSENKVAAVKTVYSHVENDESRNTAKSKKHAVSISLNDRVGLSNEINKRTTPIEDKNIKLKKPRKIDNQKNKSQSNRHKENNLKNISQDKNKPEIKLDRTLSSNDSLKSIIDNVNRIIENNKKDEASSSSPNKNEKK